MSDKKKPKAPQYVTPTGIAKYPWLNKPDAGNDKVKKRVPEYHVTLRFRNDDAAFQAMLDKLRPIHADAVAKFKAEIPIPKQKKCPIVVKDLAETEYDDAGNETGWSSIRFKMNSVIEDKKTKEKRQLTPVIVDGLKQPVKNTPIYGGSKLKVAFGVAPFHVEANNMVGLTFYMNAVQIVELAQSQSNAANAFDVLEDSGLGDASGFDSTDGEGTEEGAAAAAEAGDDF